MVVSRARVRRAPRHSFSCLPRTSFRIFATSHSSEIFGTVPESEILCMTVFIEFNLNIIENNKIDVYFELHDKCSSRGNWRIEIPDLFIFGEVLSTSDGHLLFPFLADFGNTNKDEQHSQNTDPISQLHGTLSLLIFFLHHI